MNTHMKKVSAEPQVKGSSPFMVLMCYSSLLKEVSSRISSPQDLYIKYGDDGLNSRQEKKANFSWLSTVELCQV